MVSVFFFLPFPGWLCLVLVLRLPLNSYWLDRSKQVFSARSSHGLEVLIGASDSILPESWFRSLGFTLFSTVWLRFSPYNFHHVIS